MSVCLNNLSSYNQTCFYKARMENKEGEMHWIIRVRHACQPSGGAVLHKTNKSLQLLGSTDSNQNPHKWIGHICVPLVTYVFKWLVGSKSWNMWDSSDISQSYNELINYLAATIKNAPSRKPYALFASYLHHIYKHLRFSYNLNLGWVTVLLSYVNN